MNKIKEHNTKKQQQLEYERSLKQMEEDKLRLEQGRRQKKEHKKYLKSAFKEHVEVYGDKPKGKGFGKGTHTKNQRLTW